MQYALYLPNFGKEHSARGLADLAQEAEQAGWDGFFLWDHVIAGVDKIPTLDIWVALTAMAMTTERIRLGATVTPLPRRHPWKLARDRHAGSSVKRAGDAGGRIGGSGGV